MVANGKIVKVGDLTLIVIFTVSFTVTVTAPFFPWYETETDNRYPDIWTENSVYGPDFYVSVFRDVPAFPEFDIYGAYENSSGHILFVGAADLSNVVVVYTPILSVISVLFRGRKDRKEEGGFGKEGGIYGRRGLSFTGRLLFGYIRLYPLLPLITGIGLFLRLRSFGLPTAVPRFTPISIIFVICAAVSVILIYPIFYKGPHTERGRGKETVPGEVHPKEEPSAVGGG